MGWSPPADSIIHASLISRALAEAISSEAPGADDLRCGAVSYNCQIGDSSMRVTCRGIATFDDVNSANDCLHYVSPAGRAYEQRNAETMKAVP